MPALCPGPTYLWGSLRAGSQLAAANEEPSMEVRARRRVPGRLYLPLKVRGPLIWPPAYLFRQGLALELLPLLEK